MKRIVVEMNMTVGIKKLMTLVDDGVLAGTAGNFKIIFSIREELTIYNIVILNELRKLI